MVNDCLKTISSLAFTERPVWPDTLKEATMKKLLVLSFVSVLSMASAPVHAQVPGSGNTVVPGHGNIVMPGNGNVVGYGNTVGNQWGSIAYSGSFSTYRNPCGC